MYLVKQIMLKHESTFHTGTTCDTLLRSALSPCGLLLMLPANATALSQFYVLFSKYNQTRSCEARFKY